MDEEAVCQCRGYCGRRSLAYLVDDNVILSSERHQSILTSATSAAKGTRFASAWVSLSQQIKNTSPQTTGRSTHPDYLLVNLDEESIPMRVRNAL